MKRLSILGDSISTYLGVSDNKDINKTLVNNKSFYKEPFPLEKTYWSILLSELSSAKTAGGKVTARIRTLIEKAEACVFMSYPKMNENCILCGKCVLSCPKSALKIENKKIMLDKSKCIGCLCCDEMCPNGAVDIGKTLKRRLP
jgi:ferredoxin